MEDLKIDLDTVLYPLNYAQTIKEICGKLDKIQIIVDDSLEERENTLKSLEWAMNNKETNFKEIIPLPKGRFTNKQIFHYLEQVYLFLKKTD